ncbi:MAG: beta-galactosidase, partial [Caulobacter sp.]|nr:beta-galactosidase [Caulobacter sp.]
NTGATYTPAWVKTDGRRFPRMRRADGSAHYALSPHGSETLAADARAFSRLMAHLRERDPQHTVIMVQVENETGSYDLARDRAAAPERLFAEPIPAELARALGVARKPWAEAFGPRAEQFFMTWHIARYVDEVAAAGKREWDVPMYVNAALGNAFTDEQGDVGPSGGPNW